MAAKITRSSTLVPKVKKPRNPNEKRGGKMPGAGRPKGARNKKKRLAERGAMKELTKEIIAKPGITPLEFMLKVMRNPNNSWAARQTAARDAAPYVHPRLASVIHKGDMKEPITTVQMPEEVFRQYARQVLGKI